MLSPYTTVCELSEPDRLQPTSLRAEFLETGSASTVECNWGKSLNFDVAGTRDETVT